MRVSGGYRTLLLIGRPGRAPALLQHLDVEAARCRQSLHHSIRSQIPAAEYLSPILAAVLQTKLGGQAVKVPGKVLHRANVSANGRRGVLTTLQLLKHDLT
jgi:hypothetical protein